MSLVNLNQDVHGAASSSDPLSALKSNAFTRLASAFSLSRRTTIAKDGEKETINREKTIREETEDVVMREEEEDGEFDGEEEEDPGNESITGVQVPPCISTIRFHLAIVALCFVIMSCMFVCL